MAGRRIGITGNIGAGKTTVCREFERLGVPVYYADARAKELMIQDPTLREAIAERFGQDSYTPEGLLDRAYLSKRVFGSEPALAELNALVHPVVARDADLWHERQLHPYTLHEAAILYEIGAAHIYDAVIVVACPLPTRLARVIARDGVSQAAVELRVARQWSDEAKEELADYLIHNDGKQLILPQVLATDRSIRTGSRSR